MLKDIDIRKALLRSLDKKYSEDKSTLVVEELGLCQGNARIDIAVVNGSMHGYEIKSDHDTLNRLPNQMMVYRKILDKITIVAGSQHIREIRKIVPRWCGISEVYIKNKEVEVELKEIRTPKQNPKIDPFSVVQLIWREEALNALTLRGLEKGCISKPRNILWKKLVHHLSKEDLCALVRYQLRTRENWRLAHSRVLDDDLSQLQPTA